MAIPTVPNGTVRAVHLRKPSVSGGKDWIGVYTTASEFNGHLVVINGKTSLISRGGGQCRPVKDLGSHNNVQVAVNKKIAEGYAVVDEYDQSGGWLSQRPPVTAAPPPPPPPQPVTPSKPAAPPPTTPKPSAAPRSILSHSDGEKNDSAWFW